MREYKEKDLESFIEAHLLKSGYIKRARAIETLYFTNREKGILKALKSPIEIRGIKIHLA